MPSPDPTLIANALKKLANLNPSDLIPMPHDIGELNSAKPPRVRKEQWLEYRERFRLYSLANKAYVAEVSRPPPDVVTVAWRLIEEGFKDSAALNSAIVHALDDRSGEDKYFESKASLIIAIGLFIGRNAEGHKVTYNDVFDAICRRYSDHYIAGPARQVRDMAPARAKRARRDLLFQCIDINKIWHFLVTQKSSDNLFYALEFQTKASVSAKARRGEIKSTYTVIPKNNSCIRKLRDVLVEAGLVPKRGISIKLASDSTASDNTSNSNIAKSKYCADVAYNNTNIGSRVRALLIRQSATTLLFNRKVFIKDFDEMMKNKLAMCKELTRTYAVDVTLDNAPRQFSKGGESYKFWSAREEYLYFRSIEFGLENARLRPRGEFSNQCKLISDKIEFHAEEWRNRHDRFLKWLEREKKDLDRKLVTLRSVVEAAVQTYSWRRRVRALLSEYDRAVGFIETYGLVYEQVRKIEGELIEIRSDFSLSINRRYHPQHMWPTYVSDKDLREANKGKRQGQDEDGQPAGEVPLHDEAPERSYRRRWFSARHPRSKEPCPLVGYDISSSQTQIVATFLSSAKLELDATGRSFKESLAELAWEMHCDPNDEFKLRKVEASNTSPNADTEDYRSAQCPKLQNLCKRLWMTVSYGGDIGEVVREQNNDPDAYGPAWTQENAGRFISALNKKYPAMARFLDICRHAAGTAYAIDKTAGVTLIELLDNCEIRWNPTERSDTPLENGPHKLMLSLPRQKQNDPDYTFSVDDSYPVDMNALRKMFAPCFVHMLDAFYSSLVMEKLVAKGVIDFVAIHDCWLVPETILAPETGQERDGRKVLEEVFEEVNREWYNGLGPAYEALLNYVKDKKVFREIIREAWDHWKQRCRGGYVPKFQYKID